MINCESNQLEHPELRTQAEIVQRVEHDENTITKKICFVDNESIPPQRIKSDPLVFPLELVEENIYFGKGGYTSASADGFWVFLKPLPRGQHVISFNGACENGRLNSGAIYHIVVG